MNYSIPIYCSKCGMRIVPAPNLCSCQPAPAERMQQIIAERDALREQMREQIAELVKALELAQAYVNNATLDGAYANCAMSARRALDKIAATLAKAKGKP